MHHHLNLLLSTALALTAGAVFAAEKEDKDAKIGLHFKPVFLDSKNNEGGTVAVEYTYKRDWKRVIESPEPDETDYEFDAVRERLFVAEVRGSGTIAANAKRNPNKFLDLGIDWSYQPDLGPQSILGVGGRIKAEADQSFDNKQFAYLLQLSSHTNDPLGPKGWLWAYLNFGRIDPKGDEARKTALGGSGLSAYNRWDVEAIYHYYLRGSLGGTNLKSLEVQYRHFQEVGAPGAVKAAGLDRHRLGTVRLNMANGLFVAYSKGSLPFDKQSDRAVKVGWSYQLGKGT